MPKPFLIDADAKLEDEIIHTMYAGLKEWRPDLQFPESYSDMQACIRALFRMYEIKRRPLVIPLKIKCHICEGLGHLVTEASGSFRRLTDCEHCKGYGYVHE